MQGSPRIDELRQKFHENPRRYFAPLANEYRKAGDPEQAIAICRAHLAQQPQHMSGHVVYGQALYDAKRAAEAREVFEKALSLDPDNTIVLRRLGDIAREKGESPEARHWYSKALDLDPQDSEAAAYLAELAEPVVGAPEPSETAQTIEADAEEGVAEATPPEEQGDGAETAAEPESTFVMSSGPDEPLADTQVVPEKQEARATDDGMPEAEQPPEAVEEPEPDVLPEPIEAPEPDAEPEQIEEPDPDVQPEPLEEPEPVEELEFEAELEPEIEAPTEPEVPWRKTPHPVESPFVTRTMAELYVKQGYTAAALDVYRQLAIRHPDDSAIRERIEELSPSVPAIPAIPELSPDEAAEAEPAVAESIYMADTDFSPAVEDRTGAPVDSEGRHFSESELPRDAEIRLGRDTELVGGAEEHAESGLGGEGFGSFDDAEAFEPTLESEIRREDVWGDLSEEGAEEAFGERVAELDWTDPGFGFGASEPEAPETETVAELEKREDETEGAEEGTGVANGARFVEMPVMLGEFQTSIDEAGMASSSPHESDTTSAETGAATEPVPPMPATTDGSVEADFRGDEAAAAMAAGEATATEPEPAPEPAREPETEEALEEVREEPVEELLEDDFEVEVEAVSDEEESGVVAYSPEPPRDEDLPHFTPKIPTVREFFATLGSRKPPAAGTAETFTARAAVPDVATHVEAHADDLPLATDAFSNLFPEDEIAEEDTRAAFAISGALSGATHNPVPDRIQTPQQPQETVATETQAQESEEDIRRFREWLDGLADS